MSTTTVLRARRTRFDLAATPSHWVPGDPQTTHAIDVLHVVLPPGERWFCDVYRDVLPLIADAALREDVKGFIGQEATHAKAHDLGLAHLTHHGIDLRREVALADQVRTRARRIVRRLPQPLRRRAVVAELAAIAAIEHFTAVLGQWILDADALDAAGTDPVMLDLLRWHGAEEVEHRSVAFDVYQHLGGGYARRAIAGVLASIGLAAMFVALTARLVQLDPVCRRGLRWRDYARARDDGRLPGIVEVGRTVRVYLQRDHHPSHHGSPDAAISYLATSPGIASKATA